MYMESSKDSYIQSVISPVPGPQCIETGFFLRPGTVILRFPPVQKEIRGKIGLVFIKYNVPVRRRGSPPIHWPIMGSGVFVIVCIPGNWVHPATSIEQKTRTEMMPPDCISDIESF